MVQKVLNEMYVSTSFACTSGGGGTLRAHLFLTIIQAEPLVQRAWQGAHSALAFISEDLIIHEHLKSFQFIKHLSSKIPCWKHEKYALYNVVKVNRLHIIYFLTEGRIINTPVT